MPEHKLKIPGKFYSGKHSRFSFHTILTNEKPIVEIPIQEIEKCYSNGEGLKKDATRN